MSPKYNKKICLFHIVPLPLTCFNFMVILLGLAVDAIKVPLAYKFKIQKRSPRPNLFGQPVRGGLPLVTKPPRPKTTMNDRISFYVVYFSACSRCPDAKAPNCAKIRPRPGPRWSGRSYLSISVHPRVALQPEEAGRHL